jgi:protein required for attachment to host cells
MARSRSQCVVVGDGRKALLLDNAGTHLNPRLIVKEVMESQNPPNREHGNGRPGRAFQSVGPMRSSVEQSDRHQLAEQRFAGEVIAALARLHQSHPLDGLTLVAPPKTLSFWRDALSDGLKSLVVAEIDKDLTHLPVPEIEQHLARARALR